MKLRLGATLGFGVGYYFGAKAGRERYLEMQRVIRRVRRSDAIDSASEKAKAVVDLTMERAKDLVGSHVYKNNTTNGDEAQEFIVVEP